MNPEITIKITFGQQGEGPDGATRVAVAGVEIAPPEVPRGAAEAAIPPPPSLEGGIEQIDTVPALPEAQAAPGIAYPPPPDLDEPTSVGEPGDALPPLPKETAKKRKRQSKAAKSRSKKTKKKSV